jgi:hypothetical protein
MKPGLEHFKNEIKSPIPAKVMMFSVEAIAGKRNLIKQLLTLSVHARCLISFRTHAAARISYKPSISRAKELDCWSACVEQQSIAMGCLTPPFAAPLTSAGEVSFSGVRWRVGFETG